MSTEEYKNARQRRNGATIVKNTLLDDSNITLQAKGLMSIFLSNHIDWTINFKEIINRSKNGRDAHYTVMTELITAGYFGRVYEKGERNKLVKTHYIFSDLKEEVKDEMRDTFKEILFKGHTFEYDYEEHFSKRKQEEPQPRERKSKPFPDMPDMEQKPFTDMPEKGKKPFTEKPDTEPPEKETQYINNTKSNKTNNNKTKLKELCKSFAAASRNDMDLIMQEVRKQLTFTIDDETFELWETALHERMEEKELEGDGVKNVFAFAKIFFENEHKSHNKPKRQTGPKGGPRGIIRTEPMAESLIESKRQDAEREARKKDSEPTQEELEELRRQLTIELKTYAK